MDSLRLWLTPGMGVKRHVFVAVLGALLLIVGALGVLLWFFNESRSTLSEPIEDVLVSGGWRVLGGWVSLLLFVAGAVLASRAVASLNNSLLSNWLEKPHEAAQLLHRRIRLGRGPRVVAVGGGSGLSNLLRGLREETSNLTAVVAVSDDGGSSGRLRDAFDMPAPGDLTDCLAALSDQDSRLSALMQYRFVRGGELSGHTFGNILITSLTEVEGDFGEAVRLLNRTLNLSGAVFPATSQPVSLEVVKTGGELVRGESNIRRVPGAVRQVRLEPALAPASDEVVNAVSLADLVVLGPGSLFTSTLPPLLVPGVRAALAESAARLVYVVNIMTEAGETDGFDAFDHVSALLDHGIRKPDAVLFNSTPVDDVRRTSYRAEGAELVLLAAERLQRTGVGIVLAPVMGRGVTAQHDGVRLAKTLTRLARPDVRLWRRIDSGAVVELTL